MLVRAMLMTDLGSFQWHWRAEEAFHSCSSSTKGSLSLTELLLSSELASVAVGCDCLNVQGIAILFNQGGSHAQLLLLLFTPVLLLHTPVSCCLIHSSCMGPKGG